MIVKIFKTTAIIFISLAVIFSGSAYAKAAFSAAQRLDADESSYFHGYTRAVATAPNGNIYITWAGTPSDYFNPDGVYLAVSSDGGKTFSVAKKIDPVTIADGRDVIPDNIRSNPSIDVGINGEIYITYLAHNSGVGAIDIRLAKSVDNGNTFQFKTVYQYGDAHVPEYYTYPADPTVRVAPDGDVCVAWNNIIWSMFQPIFINPPAEPYVSSSNAILVTKSSDGGDTFTTLERATSLASGDAPPSINIADNGNIYVIYHQTITSNAFPHADSWQLLHCAKSTDGGLTFSDVSISDSLKVKTAPDVAVDSSGNIYVATFGYYDDNDASRGTYICKSANAGVSFSAPLKIGEYIANPYSASTSVSIAAASNNNIYVAWESYNATTGNFDIALAKSINGGVSFLNIGTMGNLDSSDQYPSMDVDANGRIDLVWLTQFDESNAVYFALGIDTPPTHIVLADLNGDGIKEPILNLKDKGLWAKYPDNTWRRITYPYQVVESIATGDINGDGKEEVICGMGSIGLQARYEDGSWAQLHSLNPGQITTADINGDGKKEVIVDFGPGVGLYARYEIQDNPWAWEFLGTDWTAVKMISGDVNADGRDEVVADFGPGKGIYIMYTDGAGAHTWDFMHSLSAVSIAIGNIDQDPKKEVVVDFGSGDGKGMNIWRYQTDGSWPWEQLDWRSAESIILADQVGEGVSNILADFGTGGLWQRSYANTEWTLVDTRNPEEMAKGDVDGLTPAKDTIIADFGAYTGGIIALKPDATKKTIYPVNVTTMAAGDVNGDGTKEEIVSCDTNGLWVRYADNNWSQISVSVPRIALTGDVNNDGKSEVIADFGIDGVKIGYHGSPWTWELIHPVSPVNMSVADIDGDGRDDIAFNYNVDVSGPVGVFIRYSNGEAWPWEQIVPTNAATLMTTGDFDGDGKADLALYYGPETGVEYPGVYIRYSNGAEWPWEYIHQLPASALLMADVNNDDKDELIIDFGPEYGVWIRQNDPSNPWPWNWVFFTPQKLATGDFNGDGSEDILFDYGAPGTDPSKPSGMHIRYMNTADEWPWEWIHNLVPVAMLLSDINGDGKAEILLDFGPEVGMYIRSYDPANPWPWVEIKCDAPVNPMPTD